MARTTHPLTNTEVKQAKPKDKVYTLSDGGGLQLRVKPNGSKLWLLDYQRPYTKKRTSLSLSLGSYPIVTLALARSKKDEAKKLLLNNIDPQEHRDNAMRTNECANTNTLENISAQWITIKKSTVSEGHSQDTWRSLEKHIFLTLGKHPIHKVTAIKAIDAIKPIAAKGSLETVKRLCQRLNEIMLYAVNVGLINATPPQALARRSRIQLNDTCPR